MGQAVPLTYAQKFIHGIQTQLGPSAPLLQLASCVRIRGQIDVARFERAAMELMTRYPILCSRLDISGGEPVQRQGGLKSSLEIVDVSDYTDRQVDSMLSARADQPLDLFRENPFRISLLRTGPGEAVLMLLVHHVFFDESAKQMLLMEYLTLALADSACVTASRRHGSDHSFLTWATKEQQLIRDGTFSRRAQYWISHLKDGDPALHLSDRRTDDPAIWTPAAASFSLGGDEFQAFSDRASRLGVSQFSLATSVIFHILRQVTFQDIILLTVITNTRRPPFGRTIGQFAGTFPLGQHHRDGGLGDAAVRMVFRGIMTAIREYVPDACFAEQVSWLRDRYAKGYSMTDVSVDFMAPRVDDWKGAAFERHEIAPFRLNVRAQPESIPYHGLAMKFFIHPGRHSLEWLIQYDSAVVGTQTAATMINSLSSSLALP